MKSRGHRHLLLQHLEGVSWRILEAYPQLLRAIIRKKSGVYALYRKDKLYYVGLASNLMGRIEAHLRDRHHGSWDRFNVYLTAQTNHIQELEALVLRIVNPAGNKQISRFPHAENLALKLNRRMSDADADRRARLLGGHVARRRRRAKTSRARGTVVLSGVVDRRIPLRGRGRHKHLKATLGTDGRIRFKKHTYDSPSAAAQVATGVNRNGWTFWQYRDERRRWTALKQLRR